MPVDLHPGERVGKNASPYHRVPRARVREGVVQTPLQAKNLMEALDVAARERQFAQPRAGRLWRAAPGGHAGRGGS